MRAILIVLLINIVAGKETERAATPQRWEGGQATGCGSGHGNAKPAKHNAATSSPNPKRSLAAIERRAGCGGPGRRGRTMLAKAARSSPRSSAPLPSLSKLRKVRPMAADSCRAAGGGPSHSAAGDIPSRIVLNIAAPGASRPNYQKTG